MNVDSGLDAIISSTSISSGGQRAANFKKAGNKSNKKPANNKSGFKNRKAGAANNSNNKSSSAELSTALSSTNPLYFAKRAIVSNMPLDVDEKSVRAFFGDKVGRIRNIQGAYKDNGAPTGTYTINFEKSGKALELMEKFHNEPVDGGKRRLNVQIILTADIATPPKPLSERIGGAKDNGNVKPAGRKQSQTKTKAKAVADKPKPAKASANGINKGKKAQTQKRSKPKKVSVAQLDAEMSDYFAKAQNDDINV